jgi:sugar (pentulose or hexulose) kinase
MEQRSPVAGGRAEDAILIGIDVGLSFLKVAAFDARGRLVARGSRPYDTRRPAPDRVEEDPDQWVTLSADLVRQFLAEGAFRPVQVAGISISARGSGAVFVDAAGRVLAPHWLDGRQRQQSRRLSERFGVGADTRALPSKTLYLAEHHPDLFARLQHPLFVKDFVLYRLTGVVATDPSSGPRGMVWRPGSGRPSASRSTEFRPCVRTPTSAAGCCPRRQRSSGYRPASRSASAATMAPAPTAARATSRTARSA